MKRKHGIDRSYKCNNICLRYLINIVHRGIVNDNDHYSVLKFPLWCACYYDEECDQKLLHVVCTGLNTSV